MDTKLSSKPITLYYGIETSKLNQILKDLYELSMGFAYEDYEKEARKYIQNSARILEEPAPIKTRKSTGNTLSADSADIILPRSTPIKKKKGDDAAASDIPCSKDDESGTTVEAVAKTVAKKKKMNHIPHNMIEVWHEDISGQVYLVDRYSNVFTNNLDNPTLIGFINEDNRINYLDGYEGW
jgi:hypothetical protein